MNLPPQPSIELFGIMIQEPVTTFTDLIVSAVCFYAFYKLIAMQKQGKLFIYLKMYFLLMGIATTFGGVIGHAFLYKFPATYELPEAVNNFIDSIAFLVSEEEAYAWKLPGWIISMLSIMFVERAAIEHVRPIVRPIVGKSFRVVNLVELFTFMLITFITLNFHYVEIHSGYGLMFVVLSLQLYAYVKTRDEGSKLFLIGVAWAAVAALFYMYEVGLNKWFNHNDISHTLMAVAAYFFYLGARKMVDFEHASHQAARA